jgi:GTPase SAR1 family protein
LPQTTDFFRLNYLAWIDIRTWHNNIEQHATDGVNKILIGNKSDWTDKRAVTIEQGQELAKELGVKFMETSAKVNEGVEEAFFTLARSATSALPIAFLFVFSDQRLQRYQDSFD